jgi:FkbM family methyltransferase
MAQAVARARVIPVASVIDIGASNGSWSRLARSAWPNARFLLVEANPFHRAALERSRMDFVLAAAGDISGAAHFDASDPWGGVASHVATGEADIVVPMTTVDDEVARRRLPGPYLIKLDTHGFEREILEGAAQALAHTSLLVIEAYNFELRPGSMRFHELVAFAEKRGFRCFDLADPMRRPKDGVLWQLDLLFTREDQFSFADVAFV